MFNQFTLLAGLFAITASFGAGWWVRANVCQARALEAQLAAERAAMEQTIVNNEIASAFELVRATHQQTRMTIHERIANAKDSTFGCIVNDDGLRIISAAGLSGNPGQPKE